MYSLVWYCTRSGILCFIFKCIGIENTKGLLEVREVGIITVPYVEGIKLKLVVRLTDKVIERIPKKNQINLLGLKFPKLEINGKNSSSVAKVKVKLNEINE